MQESQACMDFDGLKIFNREMCHFSIGGGEKGKPELRDSCCACETLRAIWRDHAPVIRAVGCRASMTGVVSVEPGRSTAKVTVVPTCPLINGATCAQAGKLEPFHTCYACTGVAHRMLYLAKIHSSHVNTVHHREHIAYIDSALYL
jgi:hypothetical protein